MDNEEDYRMNASPFGVRGIGLDAAATADGPFYLPTSAPLLPAVHFPTEVAVVSWT